MFSNFKSSLSARHSSLKLGFTLIELLVVVGIFIVLTAVVLARQNKFSSDILLTDLTYQVALSVRQAQNYGISVHGVGTNYDTGYGIHFTLDNNSSATSYIFFPDVDESGDSTYHGPGSIDELTTAGASTISMSKGKITAVCGFHDNNKSDCLGSNNGNNAFDVTFVRPDPAAVIRYVHGNSADNTQYDELVVTVTSPLGDKSKCLTIYHQSGQVSVSSPTGQSNICTAQ